MFEVLMYDGGVYRSEELYELIDDVGGVVLQRNRSAQMLTVIMSVPEEDRAAIEKMCPWQVRRSPSWAPPSEGTTCPIRSATSRRSSGGSEP